MLLADQKLEQAYEVLKTRENLKNVTFNRRMDHVRFSIRGHVKYELYSDGVNLVLINLTTQRIVREYNARHFNVKEILVELGV